MANIFKSGYVNIESVESVKDDVKIIKKKKLKEDLIEAFPVAARKAPLSMYLLQVCSNFRKCSISPRYTSKIENIEYLVAWDIAFLIEPGSFS